MHDVEFYTYRITSLWGIRVDGTDLRVRAAAATRAHWVPELEAEEYGSPEAIEERVLRQHDGMPEGDLGDPVRHFLGDVRPELREQLWGDSTGLIPLLGCCCGVWECWPLLARVTVTPHEVTWSGFRQLYRPEWGELAIGPYAFGRAAYEDALAHPVALGDDPLGERKF
ncbi:hypothetical protein [Streptomyces sp. NPDC048603]|uniref:hypothetical protein n=1 Tax=Streptomyces sp. NPDC048603 TaxID=3365577 RepID=UPI00371B3EE9